VLSEIVEALPRLPALTHLACPYANSWRGPEHNVLEEVCTLLGIKLGNDGSFILLDDDDDQTQTQTISTRPALSRLNTSVVQQRHRPLQFLLINVFHFALPDLERESSIWSQLISIPKEYTDGRLFIQPGEYFDVKKWEASVGTQGMEGEDVWSEARRRGEGWRSWVRV